MLGVATSGMTSAWILISSSANLRFFSSNSGPSFASTIGHKSGTLSCGGMGGRGGRGGSGSTGSSSVGVLVITAPILSVGSEYQ